MGVGSFVGFMKKVDHSVRIGTFTLQLSIIIGHTQLLDSCLNLPFLHTAKYIIMLKYIGQQTGNQQPPAYLMYSK